VLDVKRLATLFIPLLVLSACSGVEGDVALEEQLDSDDRSDFVDGVVEGAQGVILRDEAQCWSDAVIATGATPDDLDRWSDDPLAPGSAEYLALLNDCIDPAAEAAVPIEGLIKTSFIDGLVQGGLTNDQAECVLDGLASAGFDGRDMFLSGVLPEVQDELGAGFAEAADSCI